MVSISSLTNSYSVDPLEAHIDPKALQIYQSLLAVDRLVLLLIHEFRLDLAAHFLFFSLVIST